MLSHVRWPQRLHSILRLIVHKLDFCGSSILCILNQLLQNIHKQIHIHECRVFIVVLRNVMCIMTSAYLVDAFIQPYSKMSTLLEWLSPLRPHSFTLAMLQLCMVIWLMPADKAKIKLCPLFLCKLDIFSLSKSHDINVIDYSICLGEISTTAC